MACGTGRSQVCGAGSRISAGARLRLTPAEVRGSLRLPQLAGIDGHTRVAAEANQRSYPRDPTEPVFQLLAACVQRWMPCRHRPRAALGVHHQMVISSYFWGPLRRITASARDFGALLAAIMSLTASCLRGRYADRPTIRPVRTRRRVASSAPEAMGCRMPVRTTPDSQGYRVKSHGLSLRCLSTNPIQHALKRPSVPSSCDRTSEWPQ